MSVAGAFSIRSAPSIGQKSLGQFKSGFFDRDAIIKAMDRGMYKGLSAFGGYVRKVARNSLKPGETGDDPSKPGKPPHTHTTYIKKTKVKAFTEGKVRLKLPVPKRKSLFRDTFLYALERATQAVVIGPFLFNGGVKFGQTMPELQEYGGTRTVPAWERRIYFPNGGFRRVFYPARLGRWPARPTAQPAFDIANKDLSRFFKDVM